MSTIEPKKDGKPNLDTVSVLDEKGSRKYVYPADARGKWSRIKPFVYAVLIAVVAAFPLYVSGRHVYIQSLPEGSVPACGASFDYMMDVFPLMTVVQKVLTGAGECQKIDWAFLGLSMPGWVFVCVAILAVWGMWANARSTPR